MHEHSIEPECLARLVSLGRPIHTYQLSYVQCLVEAYVLADLLRLGAEAEALKVHRQHFG
jgi:hypothetical protein